MPPTVTLYSAPWCGYCRITKRFLDEHGVAYTEINIDEDQEAALRVEQWNNGSRTIPTLDVNGNPTRAPGAAGERAEAVDLLEARLRRRLERLAGQRRARRRRVRRP